jgi:predicted acetyltransferase
MPDIRTITSDDADLYRRRVARGFGDDADDGTESRDRFAAIFEYDRTFAAFDDGDIVGTAAGFSLGVTVPGGSTVPMGGTTVVTVQPTHRRRGLLRSLMAAHLDDVASREEPLAGLWASEGSIYGRFGYGPATFRHVVEVDTRSLQFREAPGEGRLRLVEPDVADQIERQVYERARPDRVGMLTRSDAWWTHRLIADPEAWRDGKSAHRHLVYEQDGEITGYARYRQKSKWENFVADGEVEVIEAMTLSDEAHRAIWGFLTSIDLYKNVEAWNLAIDDPLPFQVTDRRRVRRKVMDALWLRVMDVPAALQARGYEEAGSVVLDVADPAEASISGVYRLTCSDGVGTCDPVDDSPEVSLDADALGSLYLGGGDAMSLAAAGRIRGDIDAVTRLHRMMRVSRAPWCPDVF